MSDQTTSIFTIWREDIKCVFERDPAARSTFEVLTTYPGVHAILVHRLSHKLWQSNWRFTARFISFLTRWMTNVDIHPGATIGMRCFIDHGACVVIGETAVIGNDVTLYHGVTLGGTTWNKGKRHPTLHDHALIGTGAKILGNISVGAHARVGANSVVVEDVPNCSTVVGIPGRVVNFETNPSKMVNGVNLNHHLVPDPVGKAIACMLERIDSMELALNKYEKIVNEQRLERQELCEVDNDFCRDACSLGKISRPYKFEEKVDGSSRL